MHGLHSGSSGIRTRLNKPDLDYWLLVVEKQVSLKQMIDWFDCTAYADMKKVFNIYSIIPAADRRALKRKMNGAVYFRPYNDSSLSSLKWLSVKYAYVEPRKVLWMQSPILLFDNSVSSFFADSWFSAFVSLLSSGTLDVVAYHTHFCLGTFKLNPADLSSS
jgi:hypothetical protein